MPRHDVDPLARTEHNPLSCLPTLHSNPALSHEDRSLDLLHVNGVGRTAHSRCGMWGEDLKSASPARVDIDQDCPTAYLSTLRGAVLISIDEPVLRCTFRFERQAGTADYVSRWIAKRNYSAILPTLRRSTGP